MSSCKDDVPRDQIKAALYPIPQRAGSSTENRPLTKAGDQHKMRKTRGAATDSATHYTLLGTGVDRISTAWPSPLADMPAGTAQASGAVPRRERGQSVGSWLVPTAQPPGSNTRLIQLQSSFVMNPPTTPMLPACNFSTWIHPPLANASSSAMDPSLVSIHAHLCRLPVCAGIIAVGAGLSFQASQV